MYNQDNNNKGDSRRKFNRRSDKPKDEFDQKLVEIRRVTRVTGGGKQLSFRACVVVGDKKGRVGVASAKGKDVPGAINKAVNKAKKDLIEFSLIDGTIAHEVNYKFKAAKVMLRPAKHGRGVIAGGAVRMVLEVAGIENIVGKIRGSNSKLNNIKATIKALDSLLKVKSKTKPKKHKILELKKDIKKEEKNNKSITKK